MDLLELRLADVADPEVTGRRVEVHSPGIAGPIDEDLGPHVCFVDVGVRRGDEVVPSLLIGQDTQDRRQSIGAVLPNVEWIAKPTTVADAGVEIAVGSEADRSAVVGLIRLFDRDDVETGGEIGQSVAEGPR